MLFGHLALTVAALFTGAAFYVNFAEQPARLQLDDRALLLVIRPVNDTLMATDLAKSGPETRALIVKWNRLHAVRTLFGAAAVLCFLFALSGV